MAALKIMLKHGFSGLLCLEHSQHIFGPLDAAVTPLAAMKCAKPAAH
jgi:hypothetical protein